MIGRDFYLLFEFGFVIYLLIIYGVGIIFEVYFKG